MFACFFLLQMQQLNSLSDMFHFERLGMFLFLLFSPLNLHLVASHLCGAIYMFSFSCCMFRYISYILGGRNYMRIRVYR